MLVIAVAAAALALNPGQTATEPKLPTEAEVRANPPRTTPPVAGDARVVAEIKALEKRWGEAFLTRDFAYLEQIIAPEFRLAGASAKGEVNLTSRADWMRNSRAFRHLAFSQEIVDVMVAGDTAVALVKTSWTRQPFADRPSITTDGLVTDTLVRRGGHWQVVYRYSHRLPEASWRAKP